jgi:pimeloyl-ACP methyl ester carboxylesterase
MVGDCPPTVHERQNLALLHRPDATAYLKHLAFPVLPVTGSEDHLSTETGQNQIAQVLPDSEAHVVHGSGHLLPFEKPVELANSR